MFLLGQKANFSARLPPLFAMLFLAGQSFSKVFLFRAWLLFAGLILRSSFFREGDSRLFDVGAGFVSSGHFEVIFAVFFRLYQYPYMSDRTPQSGLISGFFRFCAKWKSPIMGDFHCLLFCLKIMVREMGLEPTRHKTHAPQTCLSTCSSTLAYPTRDLL